MGTVAQSLAGGELGRTDYLCFFCGRSPALAGLGGYAAVLTQTSQPVTDKPLSSTGHLVTTASGRRARPRCKSGKLDSPIESGLLASHTTPSSLSARSRSARRVRNARAASRRCDACCLAGCSAVAYLHRVHGPVK
jgi:hypothetical protein